MAFGGRARAGRVVATVVVSGALLAGVVGCSSTPSETTTQRSPSATEAEEQPKAFKALAGAWLRQAGWAPPPTKFTEVGSCIEGECPTTLPPDFELEWSVISALELEDGKGTVRFKVGDADASCSGGASVTDTRIELSDLSCKSARKVATTALETTYQRDGECLRLVTGSEDGSLERSSNSCPALPPTTVTKFSVVPSAIS